MYECSWRLLTSAQPQSFQQLPLQGLRASEHVFCFLPPMFLLGTTPNVPVSVCVFSLVEIVNKWDCAMHHRLEGTSKKKKRKENPKPAFSHKVQLGRVEAYSTTNTMFDCQTVLSQHTCTQGISSHISPRKNDSIHPAFPPFHTQLPNWARSQC